MAGLAAGLTLWRGERSAAAASGRALVGAIRWDAWYDPADGAIARAVERSLAPAKYHFRLPFFAAETGPDSVRIDGDLQAVMDREIRFAADAGIDYWAFDAYSPGSVMNNALRLYLSSPISNRIGYCLLLTGIDLLADQSLVGRHAALMSGRSYQKVLAGRPLYFLLFGEPAIAGLGGWDKAKSRLDGLRQQARLQGAGDPYVVLLDENVADAAEAARRLACDAIGSYAVNENRSRAPFAELVNEAEMLRNRLAATGLPIVPPVTTGFDRRPRVDHPVPWDPASGDPELFYQTARPPEIAGELRACLDWIKAHPGAAPANTLLIYAWNENDEGGWLVPTYPDNHARLDAIRRVIR